MVQIIEKQKLFVNGEWVETDDTYKVYNKYTGEVFSEVPKARLRAG